MSNPTIGEIFGKPGSEVKILNMTPDGSWAEIVDLMNRGKPKFVKTEDVLALGRHLPGQKQAASPSEAPRPRARRRKKRRTIASHFRTGERWANKRTGSIITIESVRHGSRKVAVKRDSGLTIDMLWESVLKGYERCPAAEEPSAVQVKPDPPAVEPCAAASAAPSVQRSAAAPQTRRDPYFGVKCQKVGDSWICRHGRSRRRLRIASLTETMATVVFELTGTSGKMLRHSLSQNYRPDPMPVEARSQLALPVTDAEPVAPSPAPPAGPLPAADESPRPADAPEPEAGYSYIDQQEHQHRMREVRSAVDSATVAMNGFLERIERILEADQTRVEERHQAAEAEVRLMIRKVLQEEWDGVEGRIYDTVVRAIRGVVEPPEDPNLG